MYLELANDIAAILLVETSILQTVHNFCVCIFHPAPGVLKLQRKTLCHLLHGPKLMTESFWVRSPFSLVTRTRASIACFSSEIFRGTSELQYLFVVVVAVVVVVFSDVPVRRDIVLSCFVIQ